MLRIQLGEWEWMDLVFSLPCSTKLCTGALFIHQTRPCSSDPLTKKSRINWQHQSEDTANRQLSSSVHDANNIQYGKKQSELSFFFIPSVLMPKLSCSVESLTSPPPVPQGSGRNILTKINAVVSSDWGGKWRIVNDGLIIGVCCSSPSSLWSGDRKGMGVGMREGARAYSAEEPIWSRDTHIPPLPSALIIAL